MLRSRVIPCLLLGRSGLVKTTKFKKPKYVGDPINAVKIFNEKEVDELIVLDIVAGSEGNSPDFELISKIAGECFMPLSYGGGIRSIDTARRILASGVEKIIFNTAAYEQPNLILEAAAEFGSQAVVASVDVKRNFFGRYEVYVRGGKRKTRMNPIAYAKQMQELGVGEIFLNSIDRDGGMNGYDLELAQNIISVVDVPVIVSGGAGSLNDFLEMSNIGVKAMAAGSMFVFHGPHKAVLITYPNREFIDSLS